MPNTTMIPAGSGIKERWDVRRQSQLGEAGENHRMYTRLELRLSYRDIILTVDGRVDGEDIPSSEIEQARHDLIGRALKQLKHLYYSEHPDACPVDVPAPWDRAKPDDSKAE